MRKRVEGFYAIVVGCGKIGSIIASRLSAQGDNVVVIDSDEKAFERLTDEFTGFKIVGDATEISHLRETKIEHADILITTTRDDNTNFMVATVAKQYFGVRLVIALVNDPNNEAIFKEFDIETISPTLLSAEGILMKIDQEGKR